MSESKYSSEYSELPPQDPILKTLADMSEKLEGIGRLEKKLEDATNNFTGELELIKSELTNLKEARNNDGIKINRLQGSV